MLLSFKEANGIVISRYPEYLALKRVLQSRKTGLGFGNHELFVVGVGVVIAVGDVSSYYTVVKVLLAGSEGGEEEL